MRISTVLDPQWVAAEVLGCVGEEVVQGQHPDGHHNLQRHNSVTRLTNFAVAVDRINRAINSLEQGSCSELETIYSFVYCARAHGP